MTYLKKAINLGYLFLTFKPEKEKNHQNMHHFLLHVLVCFNLFRIFFDPNTCTLNCAQITGTVDVHQVNCTIWGWNNSVEKKVFQMPPLTYSSCSGAIYNILFQTILHQLGRAGPLGTKDLLHNSILAKVRDLLCEYTCYTDHTCMHAWVN